MPILDALREFHRIHATQEWTKERELTIAISRALADLDGINSLWTPDESEADQCSIHTQFRSTDTAVWNDLCYSQERDARTPEGIIQLKHAGGKRHRTRMQEPYHFLADCVWSAIDDQFDEGRKRWNVAWLPQQKVMDGKDLVHPRWEKLVVPEQRVQINLDPNLIGQRQAGDDNWIDAGGGNICPIGRSEARFLLGKSTNPTVFGWYHRLDGSLSANFQSHLIGDEESSRILVYELLDSQFITEDGTTLGMWLP